MKHSDTDPHTSPQQFSDLKKNVKTSCRRPPSAIDRFTRKTRGITESALTRLVTTTQKKDRRAWKEARRSACVAQQQRIGNVIVLCGSLGRNPRFSD